MKENKSNSVYLKRKNHDLFYTFMNFSKWIELYIYYTWALNKTFLRFVFIFKSQESN